MQETYTMLPSPHEACRPFLHLRLEHRQARKRVCPHVLFAQSSHWRFLKIFQKKACLVTSVAHSVTHEDVENMDILTSYH